MCNIDWYPSWKVRCQMFKPVLENTEEHGKYAYWVNEKTRE